MLSLSRFVRSNKIDFDDIMSPEKVAKIQFFQDWLWPQLKIITRAKKDKLKKIIYNTVVIKPMII